VDEWRFFEYIEDGKIVLRFVKYVNIRIIFGNPLLYFLQFMCKVMLF